jgi:CMP-N-acetylneuraminic acid synthetase
LSTLALIAARGGSKGIPRKNLARVGNRSLVRRAVDSALASGVCDHIVCSTDDEEIAREARSAGADVPFLRPAELAGDTVPVLPAIRHAVTQCEERGAIFDTLIFLQATVPFRTGEEIAQALELFVEGRHRSVISVCPLERKPHNMFVKREGRTLERLIRIPAHTYDNRQEMVDLCRLGNGVYVVSRDDVMNGEMLTPEPTGYVESDRVRSLDIDDEFDLALARLIADERGL